MTISKLKAVAAALGLSATVAASGAYAGCYVTEPFGEESFIPINQCLFMGNDGDLQTFAPSICQGLPVVHLPEWNDTITKIRMEAAGTVVAYANVVADENVVTWYSPVADVWDLAGTEYDRELSVILCLSRT